MRTTRRKIIKSGIGAGAITSVSGCLGSFGGGESVAVGSKRFTEQKLLGYMTYESLSANTDHSIDDQVALGGTNTNFQALKSGDIDLYWEYTGTALLTMPPKHDEPLGNPEETYDTVDKEFNEEHDLDFLEPAPFNNTYVLMAAKDWAQENGLETLTDFSKYANDGNTDFTVALNAEFEERSDGWPGVAEHYGFADVQDQLDVTNMDSGLIYQALGQGDAEVGVGFNTNPKIVKFDLAVMEDNENFFPAYNPAPVVRKETLENASSIEEPLNAIGPKLSTDTIRDLNKRVSIDGENAQDVAEEFLSNNGLI